MATTIDALQIEIEASSTKAEDGLSRLINTLDKLGEAFKRLDLDSMTNRFKAFGEAVKGLGDVQIAPSVPDSVKEIAEASQNVDVAKLQAARDALKDMNNVGGNMPNMASPLGGGASPVGDIAGEVDRVSNSTNRLQSILAGVRNTFASAFPFGANLLSRISRYASDGASRISALRKQLSLLPVTTVQQLASAVENFTSRLKSALSTVGRVVLTMGVRSLVRGIKSALDEGMSNLYQWSSKIGGTFAQSMNRIKTASQYLKNSFAALAAPLINLVAPIIDVITDKIVDVINLLSMFIAKLTGQTTYTAARKISTAWGDASEKSGKAAKEIQRTLLSFDELNIISKASSGGSGSGGGTDFGSMFEQRPIDSDFSAFMDKIKGMLTEITAIVSGFALALGTILVLTGANIPLGLGLMVAGAAGLAAVIALNWNGMSERLAKVLTVVTSVVGGFLLAIGALLAFSSPATMPLGIALMAVGAASLAAAVAINWKFLNGDLKNALSILTGVVGGALLGIGAILAFSGANIPLGIALMAAGAVSLVTAVGLNWDILPDKIKGVITLAMGIIGGALLAVGAFLAFSGAQIPLGIALMAAGAVSLASAAALNWEALTSDLASTLQMITGILGGFMLAIGACLAFSGANIPLGLALMGIGALSIAGSVVTDWGALVNTIGGLLGEVATAVKTSVDGIKNWVVQTWTNIKTATVDAWNNVKSNTVIAWTNVKTTMVNLFNQAKASVTQSITNLRSTMTNAWATMKTLTSTAWNSIRNTAVSLFTSLSSSVYSKWISLKSLIGNVEWHSVGANLVNGLLSGIGSAWGGLMSYVNNLVNSLISSIKSWFGVHSPSTVFAEIGENLDAGLELGLDLGTDSLLGTANDIADAVTEALNPDLSGLGANDLGFTIDDTGLTIDQDEDETGGEGNSYLATIAQGMQTIINRMGNNSDTQIIIDGREVFRVVVNENNRAIQRTGASPIRV